MRPEDETRLMTAEKEEPEANGYEQAYANKSVNRSIAEMS